MARGDVGVLRRMYPTMKKYVNACRFWCGFGFGKHRYLWEMPGTLGFGDWVAPDVPQMSQWQGRIKWTGTASLCNTSALLAKIADILGETQDAKHYRALSEKTADAYCSLLTDGNGKLLEEFQTAYVLPIYLNMFPTQQIREKPPRISPRWRSATTGASARASPAHRTSSSHCATMGRWMPHTICC